VSFRQNGVGTGFSSADAILPKRHFASYRWHSFRRYAQCRWVESEIFLGGLPVAETDLLKWRHYESEIILLCIRWYLRYALSYRDLEEMMSERGLSVDHTTIYRSRAAVCAGIREKITPLADLSINSI